MKRLLFILLLPLAFLSCSREVEEVPLYRQYAARQDLTVAGIAALNIQYPSSKIYDGIACNRSDIPSDHWAAVAADILTKEMI